MHSHLGHGVRDVAQRNRDLADSLEQRKARGKPHTALTGNGAHGVNRSFTGCSSGECLVVRVYRSVCAAHKSVQAEGSVGGGSAAGVGPSSAGENPLVHLHTNLPFAVIQTHVWREVTIKNLTFGICDCLHSVPFLCVYFIHNKLCLIPV